MGAIDDLEIQFMCTGFDNDARKEPEVVKYFLSCKSARFSFGCNYKSLNTTTKSWDIISTDQLRGSIQLKISPSPEYEGCEPPTFWNSVNIVNYVHRLYAVLWGCRELPNSQHEEGAWILGYKKNFSEAAKMLDQALTVDLNFTKASTKDYVLHNQTYAGNATACTQKLCEYNLLCKNDGADSEEIE